MAPRLLFTLLLLAPLAAQAEEPLVVLLSLDGMRHDYLDRTETVALDRMERHGLRAGRMVPVFPSSTFANHVSLATGTYPDRHGIVGNVMFDRDKGWFRYSNDASWIEAEPIWAAAERQGTRSAVFFWVGSESDWNGTGASYRKTPFDSGVAESAKVDQIIEWIDLPEEDRPSLIMAWWHGCDGVGHRKGPDHPDIVEQLKAQDRELARLFAEIDERALWERTTVIVVSDHGMVAVSEPIDARAALRDADIGAKVVPGGAGAHIFLDDLEQRGRAREVLGQLEGARLLEPEELKGRLRAWHATRTGDLVLLAKPPYTFFVPSSWQRIALFLASFSGSRAGMHGFDPEIPEMATIFLALGRGVDPERALGTVHATDVAPTVAALLGIQPPRNAEGRDLFAQGR